MDVISIILLLHFLHKFILIICWYYQIYFILAAITIVNYHNIFLQNSLGANKLWVYKPFKSANAYEPSCEETPAHWYRLICTILFETETINF